MRPQPTRNIEQFLAYRLSPKGLSHKVKLFPYVMYLARTVRDESLPYHASPGFYEPAVGHYVRYENEFRTASRYSAVARPGKTGRGCNSTLDLPPLVRFLCRAAFSTLGALLL